jgi:hypothetical protein
MVTTTLEIRNIGRSSLTVIFEPWADELVLGPDEVVQVESQSPELGMWQVEHRPDIAIVHGQRGSKMRAFRNGIVVWECFEPLP